MENKVFDLLEKLYIDVQDMKNNMATKQDLSEVKQDLTGVKQDLTGVKQDLTGVKQDLTGVKQDLTGVKQDLTGVKQGLVRLENKMDVNHKALYDGYQQSMEGIEEIKEELNKLTDRVENQEIQLHVIKTAR